MRRIILILTLVLTATKCFADYRAYEDKFLRRECGGYSDYQISDDRFCVTYEGNNIDSSDLMKLFGCMGSQQVYIYALTRAGEVCRDHGFNYFVILSEEKKRMKNSSDFMQLCITLNIQCYRDNPPEGAYDARVGQ